ncbi:hypothetical protein JML65_10440 [Chryseobacterium sp. KMC2]|nr:hypothetical protein [Chryseobacterium sp. KMC2]
MLGNEIGTQNGSKVFETEISNTDWPSFMETYNAATGSYHWWNSLYGRPVSLL